MKRIDSSYKLMEVFSGRRGSADTVVNVATVEFRFGSVLLIKKLVFNVLCTSVHYKATDSHSYLLYSSSHPSHVKNFIPYSQFLRLRRLCSDDSDFSLKSEEMCDFFDKRGYPASVVRAGHHCAQQTDRQSALKTSQKENIDRILFIVNGLNPGVSVVRIV